MEARLTSVGGVMQAHLRGWAKHQQASWEEQARSPHVDLWQRVAFLAMGTHRRNGHAPFLNAEEIAAGVAVIGKRPPEDSEIRRAVRVAKGRGWLGSLSNTKCLVVPPHWVSGGLLGSEYAPCHRHAAGSTSPA
jgi:hypothetical protein